MLKAWDWNILKGIQVKIFFLSFLSKKKDKSED